MERTPLPDPGTAPELFEGVLTRRVLAYVFDLFMIMTIAVAATVVSVLAGFLTFGIAWLGAPVIIALSIAGYYAVTLGSHQRATLGMRMFDIVLTPTRGLPLDGWQAFAHPLLFWLTWWFLTPFSIVFALLTPRRQMLHDLVLGTLMVRQSPMARHWQHHAGAGA